MLRHFVGAAPRFTRECRGSFSSPLLQLKTIRLYAAKARIIGLAIGCSLVVATIAMAVTDTETGVNGTNGANGGSGNPGGNGIAGTGGQAIAANATITDPSNTATATGGNGGNGGNAGTRTV